MDFKITEDEARGFAQIEKEAGCDIRSGTVMAKIKIGDRVRIPNDNQTYEVIGIDVEQGFVLLRRSPKVKSFWLSVSNCVAA
jgi:hypothetical protein